MIRARTDNGHTLQDAVQVRVLLVDDHDEARARTAERLRKDSRLELIGVADLVADAENVLEHSPADIILLDTNRRDGRGVDACRELRRRSDAPVVAFTSFMTPERWDAVRTAGAADYLLKHIDTDRLGGEIIRLAKRFARRRR